MYLYASNRTTFMPTETLTFRETGYFSSLICDYLDQKEELNSFYNRFPKLENFKDQILEKSKSYPLEHRDVLASVLEKQYAGLEISETTSNHIELLRSEETYTITTGHQLNLFTGPLYFLYKIMSVVNLSKKLKETYPKQNFIPVFWMASEDHDFEEISFFNFRGQKVHWNKEASGGVGRLNTQGLDEVYSVFAAQLGGSFKAKKVKDLFQKAYLQHDNLATATRYLANELFKDYGLVIIDADDSNLKRLFLPQIKNELLKKSTFKAVNETNQELESLGYKVQVNPREINLFYLNKGLRERIIQEGDRFKVNNTSIQWTEEALLEDLQAHPECFSPNVLMRPLYQEVILPNLCYIGGGGEMAYWFQLKESFKVQDVTFPILLLRDSVLVRTEKQKEKQKALEISNRDLFLEKNAFINKYVRRISNINIDFQPQEDFLKQQFADLYQLAEQTDKSFIGAVKAQEVKQLKGLKHLEKRLLKAQKKVLADKIERSTSLKDALFPNGNLQERNLNFSELFLEHGQELLSHLSDHLDPLDMRFLLLTI
ncbi:bacillithiol biosynthesis cysteine-adding enzyme BshC [Winogradskyella aurantiaca]|uniref:bacillithiol biosynthesis cysteine-adding enzyme BshC n=1 Tax=Winogradskyella aurantiaca TaxID=2219558 RepID=UPI0029372847|nr:bacillithiol biosynthesis cysteine-adding enzyme BshC [Winogradskyella aurantiaca]